MFVGVSGLAPPVRLHEDAVDLLEIHAAHAVTDGLEHGGDAEVACAAEEALRGADDELERIGREGAVREGDTVELLVDEGQQVAGARGFIDDVIMPHATRKRIARSLAMLRDKKLDNPWRKHGNIPL